MNRTQKKYLTLILILLIIGVALLGWYLAGRRGTTSSPLISPTPSLSPSPFISPLSNFDLSLKKGDISKLGGHYLISDIRFSSHKEDGYERVVIDLESLSTLPPYYQVREIDIGKEPILDAGGENVTGLGPFILETILSDTRNFDIDQGIATYQKEEVSFSGEIIEKVNLVSLGDADNFRVVISLKKESPFAVSVLTSPWRIVIDVKI